MVWVCLAVSRVVSFSVHWWNGCRHFYLLGDSTLRNWLCLVVPIQNVSLEGRQALAGSRCHLSLPQKVLGETLPLVPFLVDQSIIQCLVLFVVDTALLVVLSAGEQNMHSVGTHVLHLEAFQCCAPSHLLCLRFSCLFPWFHLWSCRDSVNLLQPESLGTQTQSCRCCCRFGLITALLFGAMADAATGETVQGKVAADPGADRLVFQ